MVRVKMPGGVDPSEFNEDTAAVRIGRRIRMIRIARDISMAELGEMVGLNADRIQKYENGARKPKADLLKKFAEALGVSTLALTDPVVSNYLGVMYGLFEIESTYGLELDEVDGRVSFRLGKNQFDSINRELIEWFKAKKSFEDQIKEASSEEERQTIENEYNFWKWTYPQTLIDQTSKEQKKARLKNRIDQLQQELTDLEEE